MEEERERDVKGETPKFLIIGKYFGSEALNHMSLISEKANLLQVKYLIHKNVMLILPSFWFYIIPASLFPGISLVIRQHLPLTVFSTLGDGEGVASSNGKGEGPDLV